MRCMVCAHPQRADADAKLRGSHNVSELARDLGVTRQGIRRHRDAHLVRDPSAGFPPPAESPSTRRRGSAASAPGPRPDAPKPRRAQDPAPRTTGLSPQDAFLTSYAAGGDLREALKDAGISRHKLRSWQEHDERFNLRYHQAEAEAVEHLESEARIRAIAGSMMVRKVYRQGLLYEEIQEWRPSDAMLVKLLQAARPDKYGDKLTVTQTTVVKALDAEAWDAV